MIEKWEAIDPAVDLLSAYQLCLIREKGAIKPATPSWVAPIMLMLDLYEKSAIAARRRLKLLEVCLAVLLLHIHYYISIWNL